MKRHNRTRQLGYSILPLDLFDPRLADGARQVLLLRWFVDYVQNQVWIGNVPFYVCGTPEFPTSNSGPWDWELDRNM
jgi:hypothetical protein